MQVFVRNIWKHLQKLLPVCMLLLWRSTTVTGQHDFHQVSFLDLRGRSQQLQDVLGRLVVTEQQDLVVHPVEHTLGDLTDTQRTDVSAGGQQGATHRGLEASDPPVPLALLASVKRGQTHGC